MTSKAERLRAAAKPELLGPLTILPKGAVLRPTDVLIGDLRSLDDAELHAAHIGAHDAELALLAAVEAYEPRLKRKLSPLSAQRTALLAALAKYQEAQ